MNAATSSGFIPDVNDLFEPEQEKKCGVADRFLLKGGIAPFLQTLGSPI